MPFISEYMLHVIILIYLYMILALGLNIVPGIQRSPGLGVCRVLRHRSLHRRPVDPEVRSVLLADHPPGRLERGHVGGSPRSSPTLRLTGDYFAIVTFGFSELVVLLLTNEIWLTRGPLGLPGIEPALPGPLLVGRTRL